MKRIAFVLAAAFLGTGCVVVGHDDTCSPTATIEWDFQRYDGTPPTGCAGAGVDAVDVYVDGNFWSSYACASGGATIPVVGGVNHFVTVEGIDAAAGRIAYRDQRSFQVSGCGNQLVPVRPAEGTVNLNYTSGGCLQSPCYLWFSIYDDVAQTVAAAIGDTSPAIVKVLYPYPDDVVVRLPVGSFTLDWMEQVSSSFAGELITCATPAGTFDVASAVETTLPVSLACLP